MAHWYFGENGQQTGPVDDHAIRSAIAEGRLNQSTLVWREGMAAWLPLAQVPELMMGGAVPVYYGPTSGQMIGRTSGLAISSMVCGICGIIGTSMCIGPVLGIPAVICGHMALSQISRAEVPMSGRGMAISGLAMGYLLILGIIGIIVGIAVSGRTFP